MQAVDGLLEHHGPRQSRPGARWSLHCKKPAVFGDAKTRQTSVEASRSPPSVVARPSSPSVYRSRDVYVPASRGPRGRGPPPVNTPSCRHDDDAHEIRPLPLPLHEVEHSVGVHHPVRKHQAVAVRADEGPLGSYGTNARCGCELLAGDHEAAERMGRAHYDAQEEIGRLRSCTKVLAPRLTRSGRARSRNTTGASEWGGHARTCGSSTPRTMRACAWYSPEMLLRASSFLSSRSGRLTRAPAGSSTPKPVWPVPMRAPFCCHPTRPVAIKPDGIWRSTRPSFSL